MIPALLLRRLRSAAEYAGVPLGSVDDDATHDDALELLYAIADRVDAAGPTPTPPRPASSAEVEDVRRLAGEGLSDPEIAARLGIGRSAVHSTRRRHGIPAGVPPGPPNRSGWQARVLELLAAGRSRDEIAADLGWTRGTLATRMSTLRRSGALGDNS